VGGSEVGPYGETLFPAEGINATYLKMERTICSQLVSRKRKETRQGKGKHNRK
jgi:hypothetical protein